MRPGPLFALLLALLLPGRAAHALDPGRALTQFGLQTWQTDQGLPQNTVEALARTPDGFLWVATQEGLVRFDGARFTVFDAQNTPALRMNVVQVLRVTRDGTLWAGTLSGGLVSYRQGRFEAHLPSPSHVTALAETEDGTLWVGTGEGLLRRSGGAFVPAAGAEGLPPGAVTALAPGRGGVLWAALREGGLLRREGGRFVAVPLPTTTPRIYALAEDGQGALWIATRGQGLLRWANGELRSYGAKEGLPQRTVYTLMPEPDGTLWLGTDDGLVRLRGERVETLTERQGLSASAVYSLLTDGEGDLWVGTSGGGLVRLREGPFVPMGVPEGLPSDKVRSVLEASDGTLWVGTEGGGLVGVRNGQVRERVGLAEGLANLEAWGLYEDSAHRIWLGSFGQGLSVREPGAARFHVYTRKDGLPGDVASAFAEAQGALYVGTDAGLARREGDRFVAVPGFGGMSVNALHASGNTLWVGTRENGLGRLQGGQVRFFTEKDGLGSRFVTSLLERDDGTLWVSTYGGGLARLRGGVLRRVSREQGLPEDTLHVVLDDGRGQLWMSSNKGIFSAPLAELDAAADGRLPQVSVHVYGTAEGMRSSECNGGVQPSGWRGHDGRLYFTTIKGVASVDPGRRYSPPAPPSLSVQRVVVDGRDAPVQDGLQVPPQARNIEIHYTAPVLRTPEHLRFRYRLVGSDPSWNEVGGRRTAYFTGLAPGRYRFEVQAAMDEGAWSGAGTGLSFTRVPRFHQTRMFALLVALGGATLVGGAFALRNHYQRRRERRLLTHNAELTDALAVAQEAARVKGEFVANTSHELRTPLNTLINVPQVLLRQFHSSPGARCEACKNHFELEPGETLDPGAPCPECGATGQLQAEPHWELRGEPGKVVHFLQMMVSSGKHLLEIVDDVLDFSKLEAGRVVVQPRALPVSELFNGVVTTVQPLARARKMRVEVQEPAEPLVLWADPLRASQVLINLLTNALKFSPDGSAVQLSATPDGDGSAVLSVKDKGVGIAPQNHRLIFESFRQVDGTHTRRVGGTGLGLSIVKRLVELHGGDIWLESALGQGSTFYVRLPLAPAETAEGESSTGTEVRS
ncbi:hypothetical protein FGE12_24710 [Aggregicoccus sp. 17bor-14]|uniref:two-component regulator propeller domain-containing protein n=1 Tax=Myxococcaceae TaxID=31 RepID=UPI00129C5707|nr:MULTISPECIES: two-component regulator propeller domain-containing protein [Myxococcaceae]MBF5045632.1 hypothetical protein [Simulacricoccus sp. 17bor-14]MRI91369.1 hypothetical protein [Aggregicoccus sp. 17bor-14]